MSAFDSCVADVRARDADWAFVLGGLPAKAATPVYGLLSFALRVAEIPHRASEPALAHTQLQWWRQQLDAPADANSRHPSLLAMGSARETAAVRAALEAMLIAAEADLGFTIQQTRAEMDTFLAHQGRPLADGLNALLDLQWPTPALQAFAVWHAHMQRLRHYLRDVSAGLIYFAEQDLQAAGLSAEQLVTPQRGEAFAAWLRTECLHQRKALNHALTLLTPAQRRRGRLLMLWVAQSAAWLQLCDDDDFHLYDHRLEAGPLLRRWTTWRTRFRLLAAGLPRV